MSPETRRRAGGPVNRTTAAALGTLALTALHHVYGAYAYGTPWRLHVVPVAAGTAAVVIAAALVLRRRKAGAAGAIAFWTLALTTLAVPVVIVGLAEGGYNHALKNALFFGGASNETLRRLFPPSTYELPDDAVFEVTGVLQLAAGLVAGRQLHRLVLERRRAQ